jgi:6-pyruvoyltetrahydropterin/6-carboxytetrahydropterin synthase
MYTIRKLFRFEMAHQLSKAFSTACSEQIHGHSYVCEVFFRSDTLDDTGMIIDFGEVKAKIKDYIDSWDHSLVMPSDMPEEYLNCLKKFNKNLRIVNYNPTAEAMAKDMYLTIKKEIPQISKVRLHETVTGWAEYEDV